MARSLHAAGYRIIAGRSGRRTVLGKSRCVAETWDHPPVSQPQDFIAALTAFCSRSDLGAVFPVGDREIELAAPLAGRLRPLIVAATPEIIEVCSSKSSLLALAGQCGVPTQPWEPIQHREGLAAAAQRIGFPSVLKPDRQADDMLGFKALILRNPDDVSAAGATIAFPPCGFVLQRMGQGPRHNVYFVAGKGKLLAHSQVLNPAD
ncbi:MAG: hypothetical protein ABL964_01450 [Steroidobacteraceae bacterium]